jgi:hypothetical protein
MTTRLKFLNGLTAFVYSALILLIPGSVLGRSANCGTHLEFERLNRG